MDNNAKKFIRYIESKGYTLIRAKKHMVFTKGNDTIIVPRSKTISTGIIKKIMKKLEDEGNKPW